MKRLIHLSVIIAIIMLSSCKRTGIDIADITTEELSEHISYLASEELKGRLPGTPGDREAATYIRDKLLSFGLEPAVDNGIQEFSVVSGISTGDNCLLSVNGKILEEGKDFQPLAISEDTSLSAGLVFAGYGFKIDNEEIQWNDYSELDVKGKWVMILRADPETDNLMSSFAPYSGDRDKAMLAKDEGAAGIIFVSGSEFDPADEFEGLKKGEYSVGIPVFRVKRDIANLMLGDQSGRTVEELEKTINDSRSPASFSTEAIIEGQSVLTVNRVATGNVIMQLPGNDENLRKQYLIIGGHYDHLGLGGPGSSSRVPDTTAVHYGADDNASGIAAMLEIAEKMAAANSNRRTVVFAAFAAEEMGILGSKYMAENMPFAADSVNAMINLDMLGRLNENNLLQIGGSGTAMNLDSLLYALSDTTFFNLALSPEGYGPSDHSSFYGKNIPVLFVSTGAHLDYHTPGDTPDKINYEGLGAVSRQVYLYADNLASSATKLSFRESGPKTQVSRGMRRKGVSLGIMPDFAGNIKNGLRADFVTPGKPAQRGGMEKGDIITAINGMKINNIQDYMFRLSKLKHGETINVEVLRGEQKVLLLIKL